MKIAPHIDRFGDIRRMLVNYFQDVLLKREDTLKEAFFKALRKKEYGNPAVIKSEDKFHEFTDNFVCFYRFPAPAEAGRSIKIVVGNRGFLCPKWRDLWGYAHRQ